MFKGIPVILLEKAQSGVDGFGAPIYSETAVTVENVLVAPASAEDVVDTMNLTGRRALYTLAIPKGDRHSWEGQRVQFFGQTWRVIGLPLSGIDALVPGQWNTKVQVERYE